MDCLIFKYVDDQRKILFLDREYPPLIIQSHYLVTNNFRGENNRLALSFIILKQKAPLCWRAPSAKKLRSMMMFLPSYRSSRKLLRYARSCQLMLIELSKIHKTCSFSAIFSMRLKLWPEIIPSTDYMVWKARIYAFRQGL